MKKGVAATCLVAAIPVLGSFDVFAAPRHVDRGFRQEFAAGEPGKHRTQARVVRVIISNVDGKMVFIPNELEFSVGEKVKFLIRNDDEFDHEFFLASKIENLGHAEAMKLLHDKNHHPLNGVMLKPRSSRELNWNFTKPGEFEFACLLPGHREASGKIVVKSTWTNRAPTDQATTAEPGAPRP